MRQTLFFVLVCCQLLLSCDPKIAQQDAIVTGKKSGFLIGNEGNFQWGNASLSLYDNIENKLYKDIYKSTNNKDLGDVLQSVSYFNNAYYLVVNHSSKIEAIDAQNYKSLFSITGLISPRYFVAINPNKAYVSDMQANGIYVLNLNEKSVQKIIPLQGWNEQLLVVGNKLFVCNKNTHNLYIIDTQTDRVTDSILVAKGANSICVDANQKIWLACGGNLTNYPGYLFQIDPETKDILKQFKFKVNEAPNAVQYEPSNNMVYYLNGGLFQLSVDDSALTTLPIISKKNANLYAFKIIDQQLLLSDVKDFVQASEIGIYTLQGNLIQSFTGGINASSFCKLIN
jgi:DNA-binding beta-propeller fold protein YncE